MKDTAEAVRGSLPSVHVHARGAWGLPVPCASVLSSRPRRHSGMRAWEIRKRSGTRAHLGWHGGFCRGRRAGRVLLGHLRQTVPRGAAPSSPSSTLLPQQSQGSAPRVVGLAWPREGLRPVDRGGSDCVTLRPGWERPSASAWPPTGAAHQDGVCRPRDRRPARPSSTCQGASRVNGDAPGRWRPRRAGLPIVTSRASRPVLSSFLTRSPGPSSRVVG